MENAFSIYAYILGHRDQAKNKYFKYNTKKRLITGANICKHIVQV